VQQLECIRAHGLSVPGDVVEVPDGDFDGYHYRPIVPGGERQSPAGDEVAASGGQPTVPPAVASLPPVTPLKEGM
jgi:hypothetical protein